MISIPRTSLAAAGSILLSHGFEQQHPRIYHLHSEIEGNLYQCAVGFEDADETHYELNMQVFLRPAEKSLSGVARVQVIPLDALPDDLHQLVSELEDELETLED